METDQIDAVRRFNRTVSLRIGALQERYLDRARPLPEARLLYEIGTAGAELRSLRARLSLDSGYLSRLLRRLEDQGLVATLPAADDGRVRYARLTRTGLRERAEIDRRSDSMVRSVLAPLGAAERARLVAAMTEVERLLRAGQVEVAAEAPDRADAQSCVARYFADLATRLEGGFDPGRTAAVDLAELRPPAGALVIARLAGVAIGCGALKLREGGIGESKRMWVDPTARGLGVGRRILAVLEATAHRHGARILRLDTNRELTEAQALYRSAGYREVAPFNTEPYAQLWFEKAGIGDGAAAVDPQDGSGRIRSR